MYEEESKMLKKRICIIGLASLISMMLVGCGNSKAAHHSDKPYGAGQTSKKVSSGSNSSTISNEANSSNDNNSSTISNGASSSNDDNSSNSTSNVELDDKTLGVLANEYKNDLNANASGKKGNTDQYSDYTSVKKPNPKDSEFLYDFFYMDKSSNREDTDNHQYNRLTRNGDGTADTMFKVDGSDVTIKYQDMAHAGNKTVAETPFTSKTVSKAYLINTYYKTSAQRVHVDNYAKSILNEDEYSKHSNS